MKMLSYCLFLALLMVSVNACSGGEDSSSSGTSSGSGSGSGSGGSTSAITYEYTGSIILVKLDAVTASNAPVGQEASVAALAFSEDSGAVDLSQNTYFANTTVSSSFCVSDDSLDDVSGEEEQSGTTTSTSVSLSAGTATFSSASATLATVEPTVANGTVTYNTATLSLPASSGGLLDFNTDYTVALAGASNTVTSGTLAIPAFNVGLSLEDPEPVTVGSADLVDIIASGQAQSGQTLAADLRWNPMSLAAPSASTTDFGYQIVDVTGFDASGTTLGTVTCFVLPSEGSLTSALSQSNGSTVFSSLSSATTASMTIRQIHAVLSTPGSGSSSSDVGLVTSLGLAVSSYEDIAIIP